MLLPPADVPLSVSPLYLMLGSVALALVYLLIRDWFDRRAAAGLVARVQRIAYAARPVMAPPPPPRPAPRVAPRAPATVAIPMVSLPRPVLAPTDSIHSEPTRRIARGTVRQMQDDFAETEPTRVFAVRRSAHRTLPAVEVVDDEHTWIDPFPPTDS